ncbi:hypothetical protein OCJ37_03255 [Xanthomonas sp. AM6]|uniref:hypothetical protein n=1 Tax=Xanthomonas sp. AM6 TaxID=2982531 RepID=UPI0021DAE46A|nr:hypothetical protein [Xanthomonas sp. AM6]UYB52995.1 hypothetical protein OCJ37_03255 [Xanthomonas sp. AM6]
MSGLLWKLAIAGAAVAAARAYRRRGSAQQGVAFSQDGAYRAVPDDGTFTPPHGDVVSATEARRGGENGENAAGLYSGPALT